MASITLTLTSVCAGGNHLSFSVTGAASGAHVLDLDTATKPLTDEDREAFVKVLCRLGKVGRNNNQLRVLLENGVTVTV